VLVTDATEPLTAQDAHIAGYIQQAFKGLVVAVNKWDLVEGTADRDQYAREVRRRLKFMPHVPVLFVSAKLGLGVGDVLVAAREIFEGRNQRVPTPVLNSAIRDIVSTHSPATVGGRKLKILYATQAEVNPPTFVFSVNDTALLHFSYKRYIENELRKRFGFSGTALRLKFQRRGKRWSR
jgi:GTP-binding protein